jgi:hypothetical protein
MRSSDVVRIPSPSAGCRPRVGDGHGMVGAGSPLSPAGARSAVDDAVSRGLSRSDIGRLRHNLGRPRDLGIGDTPVRNVFRNRNMPMFDGAAGFSCGALRAPIRVPSPALGERREVLGGRDAHLRAKVGSSADPRSYWPQTRSQHHALQRPPIACRLQHNTWFRNTRGTAVLSAVGVTLLAHNVLDSLAHASMHSTGAAPVRLASICLNDLSCHALDTARSRGFNRATFRLIRTRDLLGGEDDDHIE